MWPYDNNPYAQQVQNLLSQQIQPTVQQPQIHTPKVNGRNGAEAFSLAPNSDVLLLDMNDAIIWSVQTDSAGYKTVTPFDIAPHKEVKAEDRYKQLEDRIARLEESVNAKPNYSGSNNYKQQRNDAGSGGNDKR